MGETMENLIDEVEELTKERDTARKECEAHRVGRDNATKERDEARDLNGSCTGVIEILNKEKAQLIKERDALKETRVQIIKELELCAKEREAAYQLGLRDGRLETLDGAVELKEHDPESLDLDVLNEPRDAREQDEQTAREDRAKMPTQGEAEHYDLGRRDERWAGQLKRNPLGPEQVHTLTSRVIDAIERRTKCQGIDPEQVDIRGYFVSGDLQWKVSTMGWSATASASLEQAFDNLIQLILEGGK